MKVTQTSSCVHQFHLQRILSTVSTMTITLFSECQPTIASRIRRAIPQVAVNRQLLTIQLTIQYNTFLALRPKFSQQACYIDRRHMFSPVMNVGLLYSGIIATLPVLNLS